jgi:hypothetical protein
MGHRARRWSSLPKRRPAREKRARMLSLRMRAQLGSDFVEPLAAQARA